MTPRLVAKEASVSPKAGDVVQHYKGDLYIVLMIARDEETTRERVIYTACKPPARVSQIWDRKLEEWVRFAKDESGAKVPRYRNIAMVKR